jgi:hypothetical protein
MELVINVVTRTLSRFVLQWTWVRPAPSFHDDRRVLWPKRNLDPISATTQFHFDPATSAN